ncbi:MAG: AlpA family transcriptional regulator [Burkholderiaceae bacterium]|nr:AlpA family transcriptional regulator [Burkholderiaceae bacterium]
MEADRALRLPQVSAMTGLARSTIYALIANGEFPSPFKLSPGTSAWLESDVQTWLRGRVEASRAAAAGAK